MVLSLPPNTNHRLPRPSEATVRPRAMAAPLRKRAALRASESWTDGASTATSADTTTAPPEKRRDTEMSTSAETSASTLPAQFVALPPRRVAPKRRRRKGNKAEEKAIEDVLLDALRAPDAVSVGGGVGMRARVADVTPWNEAAARRQVLPTAIQAFPTARREAWPTARREVWPAARGDVWPTARREPLPTRDERSLGSNTFWRSRDARPGLLQDAALPPQAPRPPQAQAHARNWGPVHDARILDETPALGGYIGEPHELTTMEERRRASEAHKGYTLLNRLPGRRQSHFGGALAGQRSIIAGVPLRHHRNDMRMAIQSVLHQPVPFPSPRDPVLVFSGDRHPMSHQPNQPHQPQLQRPPGLTTYEADLHQRSQVRIPSRVNVALPHPRGRVDELLRRDSMLSAATKVRRPLAKRAPVKTKPALRRIVDGMPALPRDAGVGERSAPPPQEPSESAEVALLFSQLQRDKKLEKQQRRSQSLTREQVPQSPVSDENARLNDSRVSPSRDAHVTTAPQAEREREQSQDKGPENLDSSEKQTLSGGGVFSCEYPSCGRVFHRKNYLAAHRRVHQPASDPTSLPYPCAFCGRRFKWRSSARSHNQRCQFWAYDAARRQAD